MVSKLNLDIAVSNAHTHLVTAKARLRSAILMLAPLYSCEQFKHERNQFRGWRWLKLVLYAEK